MKCHFRVTNFIFRCFGDAFEEVASDGQLVVNLNSDFVEKTANSSLRIVRSVFRLIRSP